jgi:hypothetical protein
MKIGDCQAAFFQESTEGLLTLDVIWRRFFSRPVVLAGDIAVQSLMWTLLVVMFLDLLYRPKQLVIADENEVVESLPRLTNEPFGEAIALGSGDLDWFDAMGLQDPVHRQEGRVSVVNEFPAWQTDLDCVHREVLSITAAGCTSCPVVSVPVSGR